MEFVFQTYLPCIYPIGNLGGPIVADDLVRHKVGCGREGGWKIMTMFIFMFMFRKTTPQKK